MHESSNTLSSYRHDIAHVTTLTPEHERELARRWAGGDNKAGNQLVEASLPFVIKIAKEYRRWGIPLEDLIQQGNLGLLRAAEKFDPDKDCRLITYAVYWIRAEIRDYVMRGYRTVRVGTTRSERKAIRAYRKGSYTSPAQLAAESGMPLGRCEKLWPILAQNDVFLDAPIHGDTDTNNHERWIDEAPSPETTFLATESERVRKEALRHAMATLPAREVHILEERMMRDEPRTLEDLGQELGVSKERVRQLEERAVGKLRSVLHHVAA